MNPTHFGDLEKVAGINVTALIVSFTSIESAIRLAGLIAALVYTLLKIASHLKEQKEKANESTSDHPCPRHADSLRNPEDKPPRA